MARADDDGRPDDARPDDGLPDDGRPDDGQARAQRPSIMHERSESLQRFQLAQAAVAAPALIVIGVVYLVGCLLEGSNPAIAIVLIAVGVAVALLVVVQARGARARAAARRQAGRPPTRSRIDGPISARDELVLGLVIMPLMWAIAIVELALSDGRDGGALLLGVGGTAVGIGLIIHSVVLRLRARRQRSAKTTT